MVYIKNKKIGEKYIASNQAIGVTECGGEEVGPPKELTNRLMAAFS